MNGTIRIGDLVVFSCLGFLQNGDPLDINESDEPLRLRAGKGTGHPMQKRLALALLGLGLNGKKAISIPFSDGFGRRDDALIVDVSINSFPPDLTIGSTVSMMTTFYDKNEEREGEVLSLDEKNVQVDFNHKYAGHNLSFEISIISFERPKPTSR